MTLKISFNETLQCIICEVIGDVDYNDLLSMNSEAKALQLKHNVNASIWDFSGTEKINIAFPEMSEVTGIISEGDRENSPRVAFVTATELQFGMVRSFISMSKDTYQECEIFNSIDDAKAWMSV